MSKKQAVLLIHGIGDQRPMDTLRGFVDTVWTTDTGVHKMTNPYGRSASWSKPDTVSESFELRRLTTPGNAAGIRTDFFEFYWAHLMQGTTWGHLVVWAKGLLWRNPSKVPKHLGGVYVLLALGAGLVLAVLVSGAIAQATGTPGLLPPWVNAVAGLLLVPVVAAVLLGVVGDAARYLHVAPANIQCRNEIRQAGVKVLAALHKRGYDRIIVVGHSLGSVIGYDILTHAWAAVHTEHGDGELSDAALLAVERQVVAPTEQDTPEARRAAQRDYLAELKANGNPWRVTDFITLGSPLAHAEVLLAKDRANLKEKQEAREFPTAPPTFETTSRDHQPHKQITFELDRAKSGAYRVAHHAAVFAATRWTNLYFPCKRVLWGDVVGGPLAGLFGAWVRDVEVRTTLSRGLLLHTLYWQRPKRGETQHIDALREALDLLDGGPRNPAEGSAAP